MKSSWIRGVDLLDEHLVPCYLRRLDREKQSLSQISLNELYHTTDIMGTTYLNNVEHLLQEKKDDEEEEGAGVDHNENIIQECSSSATKESEYLLKQ